MKKKTKKNNKQEKESKQPELSLKEISGKLALQELPALEKRLQEIRCRIGKSAVFHIGLNDSGGCEILAVENALPGSPSSERVNEEGEVVITKKKSVNYIG